MEFPAARRHASAQTTLNIYTDQWASMQEHSAEAITEPLFPGSGSKTVASPQTKETGPERVNDPETPWVMSLESWRV